MLGALIREINTEMENGNVVSKYLVERIVDVSNAVSLVDIKNMLNYTYAIAVDSTVEPGMIYKDGIIYDNDNNQIYPPLGADEKINKLNSIIADLENIISELTNTVDESKLNLDELKKYRVKLSKANLETYLVNNPMVIDGMVFAITDDKQKFLNGQLSAYKFGQDIGVEVPLSWNQSGAGCQDYTYTQLVPILLTMLSKVKPLVSKQQHIEEEIVHAATREEVLAIDVTFGLPDTGKLDPVTESTDVVTPTEESTEDTSEVISDEEESTETETV